MDLRPLLLASAIGLFFTPLAFCGAPRFHAAVGAVSSSVDVLLTSGIAVRGGTIVLRIDPERWQVSAVQLGADTPQTTEVFSNLFSSSEPIDDASRLFPVSNPIPLTDAAGNEVPGAFFVGWVNSFAEDILIEPGIGLEILVLHLTPLAPAQGEACPVVSVEFLNGLRAGANPNTASQDNIVTDIDSATVFAQTEDALLCPCAAPEVVSEALDQAYESERYAFQLPARFGFSPLSWTLSRKSVLPEGLALAPSGEVQGVPAPGTSGDYLFSVDVCDACPGGARCGEEAAFVLSVRTPPQATVREVPVNVDLLTEGDRVVALSFELSAAATGDDLVLRSLMFRDIGAGDASALLEAVSLFVDTDGDALFEEGRERQIGPTGDFDRRTQRLRFDALAEPLPAGTTATLHLVAELPAATTSAASVFGRARTGRRGAAARGRSRPGHAPRARPRLPAPTS
jgi:hypothetical protein